MQKSSSTIGIIGGGIAGLVSAYYLSQKAITSKIPHLRILLFERSTRFGGWIQSQQLGTKYDSHVLELGARTLRLQTGLASLSTHSAINTLKLLENLNLFEDQFIPIEKTSPANKNKLIYYKKNLINLNDLSLIIGGKPLTYPPIVYVLYEYFRQQGRETIQDETVKSFIYRRFGDVLGEEIVEYLLDPVLKGVYAGSVTNLSARSVMKKIFDLEQRYGSIIGGLFKTRNDKQKEDSIHSIFKDLNLKDYSMILNKYAIYYLKDGMEVLTKTLVNHLQSLSNVELYVNQSIQKIQFVENQVEILTRTNERYHVDHLISAIPSFELANLLDEQPLRSRLKQIAFVNMIVINLLYAKEDIFPKEAFGYLIPSREHSHLLGVLFDSCIRHHTDKHKHGSQLTVMMGGVWFDELKLGEYTDEQIMDIVVKELEKQMNLHEKPKLYSIARLNKAIPVSLVDFYKERKIQIHPRRLFPSQSSLRETLEANVFD
jgi:oxygen-dependent protoporphyrinogen oxidase